MTDTKTTHESPNPTPNESGGSLLGHIWAAIGATIVLGIVCCGIYPLIVYGIGQLFFPNQANGSLVKKDGTPTTDDTLAIGSALIGQSFTSPAYFHPRPSAANNSAGPTYSPAAGYDATSSGGTNYGPLNDILINGQNLPAPPTTAPATAPSTQPVMVLAYDGIRLRVIHYCLDNNIPFQLYHIKYDANAVPIAASKTELTPAEKLKFLPADGTVNDIALIDAFPHMDMSGKDAIIAADFATPIPADAVTASASGLDPHISPANAALQVPRIAKVRNLSEDAVKKLVDQFTDRPNLGILGDPGVNVLLLNLALDHAAPLKSTTAPAAASSAPETAPATTR